MKKIYATLFIISFLLITGFNLKAQVLPQIQQAFKHYQQDNFQEKIYVHTDRDFYLTGELIWFKIYTVDAGSQKPVDLSKVAYVEVLDVNNNPVLQAKIALASGKGSGSLYIPIAITNGSYKLRAYTKWMRNFGPDTFFEKQLHFVNPLSSPSVQQTEKASIDLQFFGEGGDLVEKIPNHIGFKAIGADGKGVSLKGIVVNDKNDTVGRFETLKFGMGQFDFTPLPNQVYKAIARSALGDIVIKELPLAKQRGYVMNLVDVDTGLLKLNVFTNVATSQVYLLVHNGSKLTMAVMASVIGGKVVFQIDQHKLNEGISYFTIFDEAGQAVSERLFFKKPVSKLNIAANPEYLQYETRHKVSINWASTNELNKEQPADFSMAVYRLDSLQDLDPNNIVSYLWLTSALKGKVEMPSYYLGNDNAERRAALNNLLLTQGWRKLNWDEVMASQKALVKFLPEVNGHLITGKLMQANGAVAANTYVYMGIPSKRLQFYSTLSDSEGNFMVNTKDLFGPNEIVSQTNYTIDSTSKIAIQNPFEERYNKFGMPKQELKPIMLNALKKNSLGMQVQNIYAGDKLRQFYYPGIDSAKFYGTPYKTYQLDDYTRFATMEEVIREYVREVFVTKKRDGFALKVIGRYETLNDNPLILLDGVPYFDVDQLMAVNPNQVKKLDVIIDDYFYGSAIYDSILSFSSFKGDFAEAEIDPRAVVIDYEGMQLQREFYSPVYETEAQLNSRLPDFRNLLFWAPSLKTNEQGKGQVSFYTSDFTGTYVGIMQGISEQGIPGNRMFSFEVRK